ncbi:hypothetical protein pdam_00015864 [Pocillopora damicornis]|uniref:Tubulin/FtsZ GTPase domain-containing protein n=1 Tax=Pocillopora damicornis TaxID=46731 RepID=A0A3M6TKA2_POCDA|nr:hypothetical protein pdam_00015864 [Pocillopora damicornis]
MQFWELISDEHGISPDGHYTGKTPNQLDRLNVYFNETVDGRYIPRAACLDLEPGSIDSLRTSKYGRLFSPDNCICGFNMIFNSQADSNMNDLIAEYQQYEEAGPEDIIYDDGEYEELTDFPRDSPNNI